MTPAKAKRQVVNLDAAHKARAEQAGPPPVVVIGGKEFELPPSVPASVVIGLGRVRNEDFEGFKDVLDGLFGDEHADEVLALGLELEDIDVIFEACYGEPVGEAPASGS